MNRCDVDRMLRGYKNCRARREYLRAELPEAERLLAHEREHMLENEALRGHEMGTVQSGGSFGDPTASLVMKYASGYEPRYIREMAGDVRRRQDELRECEMVCRCVEAWLEALGQKERLVIETHVLEGLTWTEAGPRLAAVFPDTCPTTSAGLRKIQQRAMEKLYQAAQ